VPIRILWVGDPEAGVDISELPNCDDRNVGMVGDWADFAQPGMVVQAKDYPSPAPSGWVASPHPL